MDREHVLYRFVRGTRAFLVAWLALVAAGCVGAGSRAERLRAKLDSRDRDYVFVVMHRGDWRHAPENSVDAIKGAIALGADVVELDVALTKDGEYVLLHDGTLDRVSDGKGKVYEHTYAELSALDFGVKKGPHFKGTRIVKFSEILAKFSQHTIMNIHVKDIGRA